MNAATEIITAISAFDQKPILRIAYDDTQGDQTTLKPLETYTVLSAIARRYPAVDKVHLRTEIMKQYSILQSEKSFFANETVANHFSLILFAIFKIKFDLRCADLDELANTVVGNILIGGINIPINPEFLLDMLFRQYHEVGVNARELKSKIETQFRSSYNLTRREPSFSELRFLQSDIMRKSQRLFNQNFGIILNLTIPANPSAPGIVGLDDLIAELRSVENRLANLDDLQIPSLND